MGVRYDNGVDLLKDYYSGILPSRVSYNEIIEDDSKEAKLLKFYLDTLERFLRNLKEQDETAYKVLVLRYRDQVYWETIGIQLQCHSSTAFRRHNKELNKLHNSLNFKKEYPLY